MHLSDNAIQTTGFLEIVKAIEENSAFPPKDPRNPEKGRVPLYLRLEGNFIEKDAIQEKVDDNTFIVMKKSDRMQYTEKYKCRLLVREDGSYAQKEGEPPSPEDAPPPKRVQDWKGGGGKGWGKDKGRNDRDRGWSKDWGRDRDWKDWGRDSNSKGQGRDRDSRDRWNSGSRSGSKGSSNGRTSSYQALPAPSRDRARDSA